MSDEALYTLLTLHLAPKGNSTPHGLTVRVTPEAGTAALNAYSWTDEDDLLEIAVANGEFMYVRRGLIEAIRVTPGALLEQAEEAEPEGTTITLDTFAGPP